MGGAGRGRRDAAYGAVGAGTQAGTGWRHGALPDPPPGLTQRLAMCEGEAWATAGAGIQATPCLLDLGLEASAVATPRGAYGARSGYCPARRPTPSCGRPRGPLTCMQGRIRGTY